MQFSRDSIVLSRELYVLITIYSSVGTSAASEQCIRTLSGSLMPVIDRLISGPRALSADSAGTRRTWYARRHLYRELNRRQGHGIARGSSPPFTAAATRTSKTAKNEAKKWTVVNVAPSSCTNELTRRGLWTLIIMCWLTKPKVWVHRLSATDTIHYIHDQITQYEQAVFFQADYLCC